MDCPNLDSQDLKIFRIPGITHIFLELVRPDFFIFKI